MTAGAHQTKDAPVDRLARRAVQLAAEGPGPKKQVPEPVSLRGTFSPVVEEPNAVEGEAQAEPQTSPPQSVVAVGMKIVGDVESEGSVAIYGTLKGDVKANEIELGASGTVDGTILAARVSVAGVVNGTIVAGDVALTCTARVNGDIEHRALSIESGAELNGAVRRNDALGGDDASIPNADQGGTAKTSIELNKSIENTQSDTQGTGSDGQEDEPLTLRATTPDPDFGKSGMAAKETLRTESIL